MEDITNVAANTEETATPQTETVNTEVTAEPTTETVQEDITQTQSFARRLKEETEKVRNAERDALISEMYGQTHNIHTYAEYQAAMQKQIEEQKLNELMQQNIPEEYAKEMIENKKFREQYESERKSIEAKQAQENDFKSFLEAYPNIKPEDIPEEVWTENASGKSLIDAYSKYENKMLKAKLAEYEKGNQTKEINNKNAAASVGSLKGQGPITHDFITKDQFESNKHDQAWMMKNYDLVIQSMKKW